MSRKGEALGAKRSENCETFTPACINKGVGALKEKTLSRNGERKSFMDPHWGRQSGVKDRLKSEF